MLKSRILVAGVLGLVLAGLAGCHGSGRVEFSSLDFRAIDPPSPLAQGLNLDRATWWLDEHERLWIAMHRSQSVPLIPDLQFVWKASLCLEGLPAGQAREYPVDGDTWRAYATLSGLAARYHSIRGIVAVYREKGERLRVNYRMEVARESALLLGGWGMPYRYLVTGRLVCVPDGGDGPDLVAATETPDRERRAPEQRPPGSRPATQPAVPGPSTRPSPPPMPPRVVKR